MAQTLTIDDVPTISDQSLHRISSLELNITAIPHITMNHMSLLPLDGR